MGNKRQEGRNREQERDKKQETGNKKGLRKQRTSLNSAGLQSGETKRPESQPPLLITSS